MFTIELRINGMLISCIYGHNEGAVDIKDDSWGKSKYFYRYTELQTGQQKEGHIIHDRNKGLTELTYQLLKKIRGDKHG